MIKCVMITLLWAALAVACTAREEDKATEATDSDVQEAANTRAVEPVMTDTIDSVPTEQSFNKHTVQDMIGAFRAAGLEVTSPVPLDLDGHSPLPPTFGAALRFQIPEFDGRSGRIFSFESEGELQMVRDYYAGITGTQGSHLFVKDNVLLQFSADMPSELADAYRDALEALE